MSRFTTFAYALGLVAFSLHGQEETTPLPASLQTNGTRTLDALSLVQNTTRPSIVQIIDENGETAQLGVVVTSDGYVITKASEVPGLDLVFAWSDGTQSPASVVLMDRGLDLLLAKAERDDAIPITWASSTKCDRGEWMLSFTKPSGSNMALRLGNISASRRGIIGHGAALGIRMDNSRNSGVRIVEVASESPAEAAGIKTEDVLIALDDQPVTDTSSLSRVMMTLQPGEQVKLRIRRGPSEHDCRVRLASKSKVVANWDAIKKTENKARESALDGVPKHTPPLHRAHQLQKRAARVGFDWSDIQDVFAKLEEEIQRGMKELEEMLG